MLRDPDLKGTVEMKRNERTKVNNDIAVAKGGDGTETGHMAALHCQQNILVGHLIQMSEYRLSLGKTVQEL